MSILGKQASGLVKYISSSEMRTSFDTKDAGAAPTKAVRAGRKVAVVGLGILKTLVVGVTVAVGFAVAPLGILYGTGSAFYLLGKHVVAAYKKESEAEPGEARVKRFVSEVLSSFFVKLPIDFISGTVFGMIDMILLPISTIVDEGRFLISAQNRF